MYVGKLIAQATGRHAWVIRRHPTRFFGLALSKYSESKGEDIVCAPSDRGIKRREDWVEHTSGLPALVPTELPGSYVWKG